MSTPDTPTNQINQLNIPLNFWFNSNMTLAIPLIVIPTSLLEAHYRQIGDMERLLSLYYKSSDKTKYIELYEELYGVLPIFSIYISNIGIDDIISGGGNNEGNNEGDICDRG
jgi:hypothetical protein